MRIWLMSTYVRTCVGFWTYFGRVRRRRRRREGEDEGGPLCTVPWFKAIAYRPCRRPRVPSSTAAMGDPFAEALDAFSDAEEPQNDRGALQPSQAVVVAVADSDVEGSGSQPSSVPGAPSPAKVEKVGPKKRKGGSPRGPQECNSNKAQKKDPAKLQQLTPQSCWKEDPEIEGVEPSALATVFVEVKKNENTDKPDTCVPIPLWPQYKMTWIGQACDLTWITVSSSEHWVARMVDSLTNMDKRVVARKTVDRFRSGLKVPVWALPRWADRGGGRIGRVGRIRLRGRIGIRRRWDRAVVSCLIMTGTEAPCFRRHWRIVGSHNAVGNPARTRENHVGFHPREPAPVP